MEQAAEEQRGGALVCGSVAHVAISAAVHDLKAGRRIEELDPEPYFVDAWQAEFESTKAPIAWGSGGIDKAEAVTRALVRTYLELEDLPEWVKRIEAVDVPFDVQLRHPVTGSETGVVLRGYLDFLERDEEGRLRPGELKTAAAKSAHSGLDIKHSVQASTYVHAMRPLHGSEASGQIAYTVLVKTKDPSVVDRVVTIGNDDIRRTLLTCLQVRRAAELGVVFPAINGWQCSTCPHAQQCADWQATGAARTPVDIFAADFEVASPGWRCPLR